MDKLRTLIVDDEELARLRLAKLLGKRDDVEVIGECASGADAISFIEQYDPQLVFLDIQMGDLSGFDVVDACRDETEAVFVFVTAFDRYALRAFDANALDYLLKPFSDERFGLALQRAKERIHEHTFKEYSDRLLSLLQDYKQVAGEAEPQSEAAPTQVATQAATERLVLKTGGRLIFVDADQVDWIEAEGVYVRLHAGTKSHLLRESLTNVENRLDSRQFIRIHRSTIVNVDRIKEITPHFNGGALVILRDGTQLKLSRSYRDKVSATLG
jgi:two-component system LytT family response regulator